jgi:hypothetical protein
MQRSNLEEPTRGRPLEDSTEEAPEPDPARKELAARILDVARERPLAAFAAVLVAGYILGRILRR